MRPKCKICGYRGAEPKKTTRDGPVLWHRTCRRCNLAHSGTKRTFAWETEAVQYINALVKRAETVGAKVDAAEAILDELESKVEHWDGKLRAIRAEYKKQRAQVVKYYDRRKQKERDREKYGRTIATAKQRAKAKAKKDHCEECGFKAKHIAQLDVDHIDGNSGNNDPSNLQTLCANCHRLKTFANGDHLTPVRVVSKGRGGCRPGAGAPKGGWSPTAELLEIHSDLKH